ncbi:HTH-type transcriptional regulator Lrp [Halobacterium jilantaiense]
MEKWTFVNFYTVESVAWCMTYENLDVKLVNELLGDGRASLRSLADDLDVSVTTVSNHLQTLEDEGVVDGYTPVVDYERLGFDVTAILQLKVDGDALPDITDRLRGHKQMVSVYEVTGDYDVVAVGKFQDTDDMNALIKELLSDADINESNTSVVLNAAAENEQFELDVDE